jgi:hypothetical protein
MKIFIVLSLLIILTSCKQNVDHFGNTHKEDAIINFSLPERPNVEIGVNPIINEVIIRSNTDLEKKLVIEKAQYFGNFKLNGNGGKGVFLGDENGLIFVRVDNSTFESKNKSIYNNASEILFYPNIVFQDEVPFLKRDKDQFNLGLFSLISNASDEIYSSKNTIFSVLKSSGIFVLEGKRSFNKTILLLKEIKNRSSISEIYSIDIPGNVFQAENIVFFEE